MQQFAKGASPLPILLALFFLVLLTLAFTFARSAESRRCKSIAEAHPSSKIKYDFWAGGCLVKLDEQWFPYDDVRSLE